ncbi:Methyltransferase CmuC [Hyphomicrobium sp. 1Nfss2.1]|uniref:uroporphyrinogen decarboxylase family protein n=1 Tax=Hyphomicrobium sp. 1Nfss2.1 TaxID=3413936 RepID=UPI003C7C1A7B
MPGDRLRSLFGGPAGGDEPILLDVGTSSLTAVRAVARPDLKVGPLLAHPVMETLPLAASDCAALGSDCARAGFLFETIDPYSDTFTDAFGVEWLRVDGSATPVRHPLEHASLGEIVKHPRPMWPDIVQVPDASHQGQLVVADAPCPGLLDLSFALRNSWVCLDDMTSNWRSISALLDWSLETIVEAYEQMLSGLPYAPDVIVYGDDLGFQQSMFVSEIDFRNFVRPRMRTLISRLRRLTPAAVCFHSCGAIRPILPDICDLGIELLNFDGAARGMVCSEIRREVPKGLIFHGCSDLVALGRSVRAGNLASVALLTAEIVDSMPVIGAPMDNIYTEVDVEDAQLGARYLRELPPDDVATISRLGPVRSIIANAAERAVCAEPVRLLGAPPKIISVKRNADAHRFSSSAGRTSGKSSHPL